MSRQRQRIAEFATHADVRLALRDIAVSVSREDDSIATHSCFLHRHPRPGHRHDVRWDEDHL
jgi:hypothetical protein